MNYKDNDWVSVDYEKLFRAIERKGLKKSTASLALGKTTGYLSAMRCTNSRMLYGTVKRLAGILGVHGATKLLASSDNTRNTIQNKDLAAEMRANTPIDERVADAMERIAEALEVLTEIKINSTR